MADTLVLHLNATNRVGEDVGSPIYLPSPMQSVTATQIVLMRHAMSGRLVSEGFFLLLAQRYIDGQMEPFEMARLLGPAWTEFDVIHALQERNISRPLSVITALSQTKIDETLAWLRDIRVNGHADAFLTPEDIAREVISTQNIESIDARMHLGHQEHP